MLTTRSLNAPAVAATVLGGAGQGMLAFIGLVGAAHGVASTAAFANSCGTIALLLTAVGLSLTPCPACVGDVCTVDQAMLLGWPPGRATRFMRFAVLSALVAGILYVQEWSGKGGSPHLILPLGLLIFVLGVALVLLTGLIFSGPRRALDIAHFTSAGLLTGLGLLMAVSTIHGRFPWFQVVLGAPLLAALAGLTWRRWRQAPAALAKQRNLVLILLLLAGFLLAGWFLTPWTSVLLAPVLLLAVWLERALFLSRPTV